MFPEEIALEEFDGESAPSAREALLERIRTDKEKTFYELFEEYKAMVFHLAYRILGDREEALDVSQEVFFTIYRKLHRFRGESSLKTWVFRIAVNRASNRCRWWNRLRRRGTVSLDEHLSSGRDFDLSQKLEAGGASPEERLLMQERRTEIERWLLRLPLHQRTAVIMRDVEGMSYEEIAEALQVSLGTVKSRIARGREELKRHLNGALG
jgi:RNA polymerase sigma-70 factor (ECF subfamily)